MLESKEIPSKYWLLNEEKGISGPFLFIEIK